MEQDRRDLPVSIHSSHTGRDAEAAGCGCDRQVSIHSSHTGRDMAADTLNNAIQFQSTLPIREETFSRKSSPVTSVEFQSTLPIREETRRAVVMSQSERVSIHSSHTGRDRWRPGNAQWRPGFNPLFPYGKRHALASAQGFQHTFQSTLPIREETCTPRIPSPLRFVSIHSSHTGRDLCHDVGLQRHFFVSIHSSHTGRDAHGNLGGELGICFNPLFPYGKRRRIMARKDSAGAVSIHSSHTGRDMPTQAPRKGNEFQSTLPIREETHGAGIVNHGAGVSIHSSHTGRDVAFSPMDGVEKPVSIHSSHTGRDVALIETNPHPQVSIHSSHTGRDRSHKKPAAHCDCFNPLFPYGKRPACDSYRRKAAAFQSTLPIREET